MNSENSKQLPKSPPKFDYVAQGVRTVFLADIGSATGTPIIRVTKAHEGQVREQIMVRVTATRARQLSKWLLNYASWAEQFKSQGGK